MGCSQSSLFGGLPFHRRQAWVRRRRRHRRAQPNRRVHYVNYPRNAPNRYFRAHLHEMNRGAWGPRGIYRGDDRSSFHVSYHYIKGIRYLMVGAGNVLGVCWGSLPRRRHDRRHRKHPNLFDATYVQLTSLLSALEGLCDFDHPFEAIAADAEVRQHSTAEGGAA